jgi:uncharacterized membrane protein YphA (DoxX/SURF4 family)
MSSDIINLTFRFIKVPSVTVKSRSSDNLINRGNICMSLQQKIIHWSYLLLRFCIAGIFIYSGVIKLLDVKGFANMVSQYGLVPEPLLAPVAIGLPVIEVLAGIGLLFEIPGALTAISGMLVMFIGILWYGVLRDLDIDCGCFSTEELKGQDSLRQALYRDFVMAAVCCYLYVCRFLRIKRGQDLEARVRFKKFI